LPIQTKLAVSQPGDRYEREADAVAEQVMRMPAPVIQRSCASCAAGGKSCAGCEEEKSRLQRKSDAAAGSSPPVSDGFARDFGPGAPLDSATRNYFEPRFGADFGRVRVHADAQAAESAREVNALAYTVGEDLVFGAGQYAPQASSGKKLLAHELTHAVQQSGAPAADAPKLQRACINDPECKPPTAGALPGTAVKGSSTHFGESVEQEVKAEAAKEKKKTPADIRKELCNAMPPDPGCTADGHGRRATAFETLFQPMAPTQFATITGVFVDRDIPKDFGAYTWGCGFFTPPIAGGQCVFIPENLETEAAAYNNGVKTVGGKDREDWLTDTLSTITHELEHARFGKDISKTDIGTCKFGDVSHELSELAAIMSEFPIKYRATAEKSWSARRTALGNWFQYKLTQPSKHGETVAGILKAIRCRCECKDVNEYIRRVTDFTTADWKEDERNYFHSELRDAKWKLDWPIESGTPAREVPWLFATPSYQFGYGNLGSSGVSIGAGLDFGIPLDRLGEWQLLVGAQGRIISGLTGDTQLAYLLGLKVGFLKGPALGSGGWQYGAFGEIGGGSFTSGGQTESGKYAGGGVSLRYNPGLIGIGSLMPFAGAELFGGARIDVTDPQVQKIFSAGFVIGGEF
jgi:hypothetical protein